MPNLLPLYHRLLKAYGPQHWWPAQTPFEVMVGAILTQNTSWGNVERAIVNLRAKRLLKARALANASESAIRAAIRPSGYFNQKTRRLAMFAQWCMRAYHGDIGRMRNVPTATMRKLLLAQHGIGEETADSILLYALAKPVFVIDAYSRRLLALAGIRFKSYPQYQHFMEQSLRSLPKRKRIQVYNEFHALIVRWGKDMRSPDPQTKQQARRLILLSSRSRSTRMVTQNNAEIQRLSA